MPTSSRHMCAARSVASRGATTSSTPASAAATASRTTRPATPRLELGTMSLKSRRTSLSTSWTPSRARLATARPRRRATTGSRCYRRTQSTLARSRCTRASSCASCATFQHMVRLSSSLEAARLVLLGALTPSQTGRHARARLTLLRCARALPLCALGQGRQRCILVLGPLVGSATLVLLRGRLCPACGPSRRHPRRHVIVGRLWRRSRHRAPLRARFDRARGRRSGEDGPARRHQGPE